MHTKNQAGDTLCAICPSFVWSIVVWGDQNVASKAIDHSTKLSTIGAV